MSVTWGTPRKKWPREGDSQLGQLQLRRAEQTMPLAPSHLHNEPVARPLLLMSVDGQDLYRGQVKSQGVGDFIN